MTRRGTGARAGSAAAALAALLLVVAACRPTPVAPAPATAGDTAAVYLHDDERIGEARQIWDGVLKPDRAVATFRNTHRLFPTRIVSPAAQPRPLPEGPALTPPAITHDGRAFTFEELLEANRIAGLLVLKDGAVVLERYRYGNTPQTRWMSMSVAKSVLATLTGAALHDGRLASLDEPITRFVPVLQGSAYDGVTFEHLLKMASGVSFNEAYTDRTSDRRRMLELQIAQRRGSIMGLMASLPRVAEPGTRVQYSTGETQVLAEALRGVVGMPLATYLEQRVWQPAGMEAPALWWLDAPDGTEIGGSGLNATLRDYGRFGQFILEDGVAGETRVLPEGWSRRMGRTHGMLEGTDIPYGLLWWPPTTPLAMAHGAFTAEGIHGQFIHIDPVARVVIVQWGARSKPQGGETVPDADVFDAIVEAAERLATSATTAPGAPGR